VKLSLILTLTWLTATSLLAQPASVHLLQRPAMNQNLIVFSYAGDLWSVPRQGGAAQRLTSGQGFETDAAFSPDGNTIAFSGEYDGNTDVFTVPTGGGIPKRITFHPDADRVVGWTPDGKRILFRSNRESQSRYTELFTVAAEGGMASALPLPMACTGAYSPDGNRLVYAPLDGAIAAAKRAICGLPAWRIFPPSRFLAPIRTTSIPCGSVARSTSSPTAMAR